MMQRLFKKRRRRDKEDATVPRAGGDDFFDGNYDSRLDFHLGDGWRAHAPKRTVHVLRPDSRHYGVAGAPQVRKRRHKRERVSRKRRLGAQYPLGVASRSGSRERHVNHA